MRSPLTLVLFLCGLAGLASSQETTLRSRANLVSIPVLVKGAKGEDIIYGLEAKDFIVEDDGVQQAPHMDEAAEGFASIRG